MVIFGGGGGGGGGGVCLFVCLFCFVVVKHAVGNINKYEAV